MLSHRMSLLTLLRKYNPKDVSELAFKKEMIEFVEENHQCFERSLEKGHVTASCWLLNTKGTHAALMHHAKIGRWLQLGGHCDGNGNILEVAIKEAQEESGISAIKCVDPEIFDLDIHLIEQRKTVKAHYHYDVRFLLQTEKEDKLSQNKESKGLIWISKNDLLPTNNPSVLRLFYKWVALN